MDCARNIITANFSGGTSATTAPLWQWDYGQVLCITGIDLPAAFEVHFSTNKTGGVSTTAVGADGQVTIPNVLLTIGKNINAWIYLSDSEGEGETEYSILIPVKARPMPETYDAEISGEFDDVVRQVSEYAETAQTAADNAGASATAAAASADSAAASASAAETAKNAAETAQGKAEDAQAAAETAAQTAIEKAQQTAQDAAQAALDAGRAESAAGRAEAAQTGAEAAKTDAETAAGNAAASASAASASATNAGQAAASAAQSASAAAQSAASIEGDVQTATQKAAEATEAADQAVAAKDAAVTAQQGAETAATNAGQSASTATAKAAEAAQSASGAAQSKTDAEAAATRAEQAAASLVVDDALSDSSTNPVQNKVVTAKFADVKSAIEDSFEVYPSLRPTLTAGYINANDNSIVASENFGITAPIAVKKGQIIKLTATGYNAVVGMIATCDSTNSTRTTVIPSIDSDEHTYTYDVVEDGYIVCSFKTLYDTPYHLSLLINYYNTWVAAELLNVAEQGIASQDLIKQSNGHYVDANGTVQTAGTQFISQSINLYKGQTLTLNARGYNQAVAMISEYSSDSDSYKPLVISIDSTVRTYTYTATETITVRCSMVYYASGANVPYSATITTPETMSATLMDIMGMINTTPIQYPQLFDSILCIGDSLTVGYDGSGDTPLTKNYPHFLEKLTIADTTIKAHGGWTAKQIWDDEISTATDLADYDCAIIFLGTNGGLTDTVSTDCKADYTQNTDNNTGCYGKIIGKIKADAPDCKIFCVAGVNDYIRRATTMNPAVRDLAEFYDVGLIDIENCIMSDSGSGTSPERYLYRPIDGIHYNALGYMTMANLMYDDMSKFIASNLTMYD